MTERYIQANGIQLAYEEFGHPADPAVLLIMGLGTQMIAWPDELCQQLADGGYRVIRFDNRDIGLSESFDSHGKPSLALQYLMFRLRIPWQVPYDLNDMSLDALGLLDALEIESAHIVGASMGGMIGQLLAANHPTRTLTLTSIMSTSGDRSLPGTRPEVTKHLLNRPQAGEDSYLAHALESWRLIGSPGFPPTDEELRAKLLRSYRRSYRPEGFVRQLAAIMASGNRVDALKSIRQPTLVIHGKEDPLIPVEGGIHTAKLVPYSRLELIDGMGHDLPRALIPRIGNLILEHTNLVDTPKSQANQRSSNAGR